MSLNEDDILKYLAKRFNPLSVNNYLGDDGACVTLKSKGQSVLSVDSLSEGIHFEKTSSPYKIGKKLASVSLSDMAAMGAWPKYILISLALDQSTNMKWVKRIYDGIHSVIRKFDVKLLGGDTVGSVSKVLSSFVIGETITKPVYRKGAKAGECIYATGYFGKSLETGHHLDFVPRCYEAKWLMEKVRLSSMTDASDGLYKAVELLTLKNKLGAELLLNEIKLRAKKNNSMEEYSKALYDGEDFELVFTAREIPAKTVQGFNKKFKIPLSKIGKVTKTKKIIFFMHKESLAVNGKYFEHFK